MSRLAQPGGGVGRRAGGGIFADFACFCSLFAVRSCNPLISLSYKVYSHDFGTVLGYYDTSRTRQIGGAGCVVLVNQPIGIVN